MAELQRLGAGDGAGAETPVADEPVAQEQGSEQEERGSGEAQERKSAPEPTRRDLTQDPQFREFQSSYDRRLAEMQRRLQEAEAKADEQAMAGMDDYEKMEFQLQRERRLREDMQQQYQMTQAEYAKREGLARIAAEHGVPVDRLDDRSPEAAEASALRYKLEQLQQKQQDSQAQETAERNRVDVGSGRPNGEAARVRARLKQYRENNDTRGYLAAVQEAREAGITI